MFPWWVKVHGAELSSARRDWNFWKMWVAGNLVGILVGIIFWVATGGNVDMAVGIKVGVVVIMEEGVAVGLT